MLKKILGLSSSLRNKRFSYKNNLVKDIKSIQSLNELDEFIVTPNLSTCLVLLFLEATPKCPNPFCNALWVKLGIKIYP